MATLNNIELPAEAFEQLRERAMDAGRTLEEQARIMLAQALRDEAAEGALLEECRRLRATVPFRTTEAEVDDFKRRGRL